MTWEYTSSRPVIGADEVGVGAIAGPVFAAAVMLRPGVELPLIRDSKQMTPAQRETAFQPIIDGALAWSCRSTMRYRPILEVRLNLMASCITAVRQMDVPDHIVVVDGDQKVNVGGAQICLVKGDSKCLEVACASVVAKVLRDRVMAALAGEDDPYAWRDNKGYATKEHIQALRRIGLHAQHRRGPTENAMQSWGFHEK